MKNNIIMAIVIIGFLSFLAGFIFGAHSEREAMRSKVFCDCTAWVEQCQPAESNRGKL